MGNKCTSLTAIGLLALCGGVQAETVWQGSHLDHRIQMATYSPLEVFRINAVVGRTSVIEFARGETVREEQGLMTMGDPAAWAIGANGAGNIVAIKPITDLEPNTNLIINTNRHMYVIELALTKQLSRMTYVLRFDYPKPPPRIIPVVSRKASPDPCAGQINAHCMKWGDMSLSPSRVWDNGTFTCFRFPSNAARPVIYQKLPDGTETLANNHQVNDIVVIHGVAGEYRLRMNRQVLGIKTDALNAGRFNYDGTTTGEIRETKK